MREERKLNKAIQKDGVDTQSGILDELKRRYPQYVAQAEPKPEPNKRRRMVAISSFAAVAASVAVIVPCAVLLPNRDNGGGDGDAGNIRYCAQGEYSRNDVEYTIGEYRENNNSNFLYFDWYEYGEDCSTVCYVSNSDNEVLCLEEQVYLPESDEFVQLSITKSNIYLSEFDLTITNCQSEHTVDNHTIKWTTNARGAVCVFEDNGYRYFIQIKEGQDENRLFELVAELLDTK